ncbi:MAG: hypothetical protein D6823_15525 [Chloroflexi bacterium]|nr:MAG: hypothetical protein D6823_15525 [Chloroflexota bacterium]GIU83014.1 MAG: hypothetical protein KatS3mg006_2078 [Pyrinomonadaceae bacterium]
MPSLVEDMRQNRWKSFLIAAVACFLTSVAMSVVAITANKGFGYSDIMPFLILTLPLVIIIAAVKAMLIGILRWFPLVFRYIVAGIIGVIGGLLWAIIVAIYMGPWFSAFSFPVHLCWMVGGASGMIVGSNSYLRRALIAELAVIAVIGFGFLTMPRYISDLLSKNQTLEVVGFVWKPGPEPLSVENMDFDLDEEVAKLASIGLTGQLRYRGKSTVGRGKHVKVVIVMQRQVEEKVELKQPYGVDVVYVQTDDGWKMYPPDAPTLERTIRLSVDKERPNSTEISIERADGSREGWTFARW